MSLEKLLKDEDLEFMQDQEKFLAKKWRVVEKEFLSFVDTADMDKFLENSFGNCIDGELYERPIYSMFLREWWISMFSYCLWDNESSRLVRGHSDQVVSVAAGGGFIEWHLRETGVDVVATDIKEYGYWDNGFIDIEVLDAVNAVKKYSDRDVLLSWPEYRESIAYDVAINMSSGRKLYYIGERPGGCCADGEFFDYLEESFEFIRGHVIPTWCGIYDALWILRKK